jgi:hypothetical protein
MTPFCPFVASLRTKWPKKHNAVEVLSPQCIPFKALLVRHVLVLPVS